MIGLFVIAAGWVCVVVATVVLWGVPALLVAGVVMLAVGGFVDLDRVKEPQRAKRDPSSP
jgi:cytochrome c-type biogenesis protein CcmH/NrfF